MVYYQKYRPQSLSEVVGQEPVLKALKSAYSSNRLSHAYLFVGPRGTGKTSTARILAKMVNCTQGMDDPVSLLNDNVIPEGTKRPINEASFSLTRNVESSRRDAIAEFTSSEVERLQNDKNPQNSNESGEQIPCNKCVACTSITDGSALDLIEIDAASNRGVEDIRDLRDKIKLSSSSLKKKVYIIDEVHMLTNEAFNALLKTLEEPPDHCLFILATTEVNKIPLTILSRVQRLDFKPASTSDLVTALRRVSDGEKLKVEDGVLELIAQRSDGAFRDGVKLLDQLASQSQTITLSLVKSNLKLTGQETVYGLFEYLATKDSVSALKLLIEEIETGVNLRDFTLNILETLRSLLLMKHNSDELLRGELLPSEYAALQGLSGKFSVPELIRLTKIFQQATEKLKFSLLASLPLEVAVVESCFGEGGAGRVEDSTRNADTHLNSAPESASLAVSPEEVPISHPPAGRADQNDNQDSKGIKLREAVKSDVSSQIVHNPAPGNAVPKESPEIGLGQDLTTLLDKWSYLLEVVKPYNYSLEAMLRQVRIGSCEDGRVILKVPYTFHQRILESPRNRDFLESVLGDILGKPYKVGCELDTDLVRVEDIANVERVAADDEVIRLAAEIFNS